MLHCHDSVRVRLTSVLLQGENSHYTGSELKNLNLSTVYLAVSVYNI